LKAPQQRPLQQQRLHRQRRRRRNPATVLDQRELAQLLEVPEQQLKKALIGAGWKYHEDAMGRIWASVSEAQFAAASTDWAEAAEAAEDSSKPDVW